MRSYLLLLLLGMLIACSEYEEKYDGNHSDFDELSFENIISTIPIINIEVDEEEYMEMWENYDEEIEIDCSFSLKRGEMLCLDRVEAEIEIKGGRTASFEIKSFGIKFEDSQDNSDRKIINPQKVLSIHDINDIKSIRLRNSGNDYQYTMLKDAVYTQLAVSANLDLDLMYYEPAQVFVNNEYYGVLNIRTESNSRGVARLYNRKKKDITMAKINTPGDIEIKDGDEERIWTLVEKVDSNDIDYLYEQIDMSNFIDYVIFQTFVAHGDWPQNNVRFYAIDEGKFRFIMFDLDYACFENLDKEPLFFVREGNGSLVEKMFEVLYQNESFKNRFDERYQEIIDSRSLEARKFENIVYTTTDIVEAEMIYHLKKYDTPGSVIEWFRNVEEMVEFYRIREENVNTLSLE